MDEILEALVEFVAELYFDFAESLVQDKEIGKGMRIFLKVICSLVTICMIACVVIGAILIAEGGSVNTIIGIVLLALAFVIVLVHVIIALHNGKSKKKLQ